MQKLEGQLITMIGGGGFVGRYVAQHLLSRGAQLRIVQRHPEKAYFLRPLSDLGKIQFVRGDVTDAASMARCVRGSDAVINLAGSFDNMEKIQADGARHIAEAVRDQSISKFVHQSAIGAAGDSPSLYGRTKGQGEEAVQQAAPQAVIMRPSIIFGREDQFVNRFANMIKWLPIVPIVEPKAKFQPVYVNDVARAIANALSPEFENEAQGKIFELAGPKIFTMEELLRWIAEDLCYRRKFLSVPGGLVAALPGSPVSRDQLKMLKQPNIAANDALGLADLGVTPTALATISPNWLAQYRNPVVFS